MNNKLICIADVKNTLGEGPVWNDRTNQIYWVDITEKWLYSYSPVTGKMERVPTPGQIGAFAFRSDEEGVVAGLEDGFVLFDPASGHVQIIEDMESDVPGTRMNDGKPDPKGRFWCGSIHEVSDPKDRRPIASVYRLDPGRAPLSILPGIKTSNGFAWSPDGRTMYFTDTPTLTIQAFDYDLATGNISNGRVFAEIPPNTGRPDGAAVDQDGCLWSAHFAGSRVTCYTPEGKIKDVIEIPALNVTSCCFGGVDMKTLFITTAREDMTSDELFAMPLSGGLFTYQVDVPGVHVARFAG